MNKEKTEQEVIKEQIEIALKKISIIYHDFDVLNGALHELTEKLDKDENVWFFDFWMKFPTYNDLDDLKDFLIALNKKEEK